MRTQSGKIFLMTVALLLLCATLALAGNHHKLNGTWVLIPTRSDFAGQDVIQTGTVTIQDREHNIYISRDFNYDGSNQTFSVNFVADGRENSTIHNGKNFKTKADWDDDVLRVKIVRDGLTTLERYSLGPDGTLSMFVERPGHAAALLVFKRQ